MDAPMPRGAGHQRLAPGQRAGPVLDRRGAGVQADHLTRDEGAFRREEKPQRAFQLIFGAFTDVELQVAAVAQLLGQERLKPSRARWALAANGRRGRGAAEDHQVRAVRRFFSSGWNSRSCLS
jgi:hypothetical protein